MSQSAPGAGFAYNPNPAGGSLTAANSLDATSLSGAYYMTKADLAVPITFQGQQTTIGAVINWFDALPPDQTNQWEQSLISAGLMSASSAGNLQTRTDAFNALLRDAAVNKIDINTALTTLTAENPAGAAGVGGVTKTFNPLDVKYLGDQVAQKLLGRDLTAQEAMAIAGSVARSGTPTTEATSPQAATQQYLQAENPGGVGAHSLLNVFEAIKSKVETDAQGSGPRAAAGPVKVI